MLNWRRRLTELKKQERIAIEAVAEWCSAAREKGAGAADACLIVAGKRVAVDIATLKRRGVGQGNTAGPRLRFDRVVIRLMERLQASLGEIVPEGTTVVLTVTAPIRLPSKTAASLEGKIQTLLGQRATGRDEKDTVHGNRIRIRLLKGASARAPKMIGFVHHSDSDPLLLLDMTRELTEVVGAKSGRRSRKTAGDRWLVIINAAGSSYLDACRYVYSQLRISTDFKKVLMVFGDRRVGVLSE